MSPNNPVAIYPLLKKQTRRYFEKKGIHSHANGGFWMKLGIFASFMVGGYFLLLNFGKQHLAMAFLYYFIFFLGITLLVVNVAHDASHRAVSSKAWINRLLSYSWNLLGISKILWELKHHHSHHIYTNIAYKDTDIAESPLLRLHSEYPYRAYYRFQHLYAPVLYLLFGIFIVYVKDFVLFAQLSNNANTKHKLAGFSPIKLILIKIIFLTFTYLIPMLVLPYAWWQTLLLYFSCMGICGAMMLLVLAVPHINEAAEKENHDTQVHNQNEWALLQIHSTVDSSTNSQVLHWLSGGLNTHLVHHLFPNICHVHYIPLTRIIQQSLMEQGISYQEKSFGASLVSHFKYLKFLGEGGAQGGG